MNFIKKYKHGLIISVFAVVYVMIFNYLEHRVVFGYHVVHTVLDDYIPFCEYFIVPYLLWFPYMFLSVIYFIFWNDNKQEYYCLIKNLCMGMTIFLIVSFVYPNGHVLRPVTFEQDNIFISMVQWLYSKDTPTNILPSIHVFNSIAIYMGISTCRKLRNKKLIRYTALLLTILIVLSTMFLKQHSVVDVCLGATLSLAGYHLFYREQVKSRAKETKLMRSEL